MDSYLVAWLVKLLLLSVLMGLRSVRFSRGRLETAPPQR